MDFGFGILFFVKGSDLAEDMRRPLRLGVDFDYFILLVIGDISLSLSLPLSLSSCSVGNGVSLQDSSSFLLGAVSPRPRRHRSSMA